MPTDVGGKEPGGDDQRTDGKEDQRTQDDQTEGGDDPAKLGGLAEIFFQRKTRL